MNCPMMKGRNIKQCGAVTSNVVLSGCELEAFCMSGDYASCPVYRAKIIHSGKLTLTEYCVISRWVWHEKSASVSRAATLRGKEEKLGRE